MPHNNPPAPTSVSKLCAYAGPRYGLLGVASSLTQTPLENRKLITELVIRPAQEGPPGRPFFHPKEIPLLFSVLPNLMDLQICALDFAAVSVNDLLKVTSSSSRYRLKHLTLESLSTPTTPTRVTKWKSSADLIVAFATLFSLFEEVNSLEIFGCGGIWEEDCDEALQRLPTILPRNHTIRVSSFDISTDSSEPVLAPLLGLLDHLFVPQLLENFCAKQIWDFNDVLYITPLLRHGNIKNLIFNLSGTLDNELNRLEPSHDMMASLAHACTGQLERIFLRITRTDNAAPAVMVTEICTALTIISLLPVYDNLIEIELSFDMRGEETKEKLIRALVGTREHWKLIDQKLESEFPDLELVTIRFEDNCGEGFISEAFQDFNDNQATEFDSEDDMTDDTAGFRRKLVQFECAHGTQQTSVTHPMQLCQFHDTSISIDPKKDFFEDIFSSFFADTMVHLREQNKLHTINEPAP